MILNHYIWADSFDYRWNSSEEAMVECLARLMKVVDQARVYREKITVPNAWYTKEIEPDRLLLEWLYEDRSEMRDERRTLLLLADRGKMATDDDYELFLQEIKEKKFSSNTGLIGFYRNTNHNISSVLCIWDSLDWVAAHRFYLSRSETIETLVGGFDSCFPNLHFHQNISRTMHELSPLRDFIEELIKHFSVLNDEGLTIFFEYSSEGERSVLTRLKSKGNIECSVQGDPVYEKANLSFAFLNDQGSIEDVICSPHTKLFNNHSNYRIYFHWGKPSIQGGKKLLIGHVGGHL